MPSNIALVYNNVLFPFKALSRGPKIDKAPAQNNSTAVDNPSTKLPLENFDVRLLTLFSNANASPISPPIAKLIINKTG